MWTRSKRLKGETTNHGIHVIEYESGDRYDLNLQERKTTDLINSLLGNGKESDTPSRYLYENTVKLVENTRTGFSPSGHNIPTQFKKGYVNGDKDKPVGDIEVFPIVMVEVMEMTASSKTWPEYEWSDLRRSILVGYSWEFEWRRWDLEVNNPIEVENNKFLRGEMKPIVLRWAVLNLIHDVTEKRETKRDEAKKNLMQAIEEEL